MRRKDREISVADSISVIERCDVCRLGLCLDNMPYIVPMNFGYEIIDECLKLYFHCALEGKKLDIIKANSNAYFEMDCDHNLLAADVACGYTMEYSSVMGSGTVKIIEDRLEKARKLQFLMKKYAKEQGHGHEKSFDFSSAIDRINVLQLDVKEFSGKRLVKK